MKVYYKFNPIENFICYWIEAAYIDNTIQNIMEYTDEVGELYEEAEWLENNPDMDKDSFMALVACFEQDADRTYSLRTEAEKRLAPLLETAINIGDGKLSKYKGKNVSEAMEEIFVCMNERFDDIYAYDQKEQVENFYKVLMEILDEVL